MLKELKKVFLPPYEPIELYSLFLTFFIVALIPLVVVERNIHKEIKRITSLNSRLALTDRVVVAFKDLRDKDVLSGNQELQIEARDKENPIVSVKLLIDNKILATVTNPTNSNSFLATIPVDFSNFKTGEKSFLAEATNSQGVTQTSQEIKINTLNTDTEEPGVSFENIRDGDMIDNQSEEIKLIATDNMNIEKVTLLLDGKLLTETNKPPYNFIFEAKGVKTGTHTLTARVRDFAGNSKELTISVYKKAGEN